MQKSHGTLFRIQQSSHGWERRSMHTARQRTRRCFSLQSQHGSERAARPGERSNHFCIEQDHVACADDVGIAEAAGEHGFDASQRTIARARVVEQRRVRKAIAYVTRMGRLAHADDGQRVAHRTQCIGDGLQHGLAIGECDRMLGRAHATTCAADQNGSADRHVSLHQRQHAEAHAPQLLLLHGSMIGGRAARKAISPGYTVAKSDHTNGASA